MFKTPNLTKLKFKKLHLQKIKQLIKPDFIQEQPMNQMSYLFYVRFAITRIITDNQISALRKFLLKRTVRLLYLTYRAFPQTMITSKPPEMRMGKGKGVLKQWVLSQTGGAVVCVLLFSPLQQQFLFYDMLYSLRYRLHAGIVFDCRF
mgnify:CR=1 FL=1